MIGQRLKQLRQQTGKTQKEVANEIGLSRQVLSHLENNRNEPDMDTVIKIANYYKVSIDSLYGNKNAPSWATESDIIELEKLLNEEVAMSFGGVKLTTEEQQRVKDIITTIFWEKIKEERNINKE